MLSSTVLVAIRLGRLVTPRGEEVAFPSLTCVHCGVQDDFPILATFLIHLTAKDGPARTALLSSEVFPSPRRGMSHTFD